MNRVVTLFDGTKVHIECDDSELNDVLYRVMIAPFTEELNMAWLSNNQAEKRAKNYMDFVASLMIRNPAAYDIKSDRALDRVYANERATENMEAPVTRPSSKKSSNRKRRETIFSRIEKIRAENPDRSIVRVPVNTDCEFVYGGKRYVVKDPKYKPVFKRGFGDYYEYDTVFVLDNGTLKFFDQNMNPIASHYITEA